MSFGVFVKNHQFFASRLLHVSACCSSFHILAMELSADGFAKRTFSICATVVLQFKNASHPHFFLCSACVIQLQGACPSQTFADNQPLCYSICKTTEHCQHETFLRSAFLLCLSPKYLEEGAIFFLLRRSAWSFNNKVIHNEDVCFRQVKSFT